MKAVVQDTYGNADVLRLEEVAKPEPGPKQVLVEVRAAGVDRGAWHAMTGLPLVARLGFGLGKPRHRTIGMDLAGRVAAVGAEVTEFKVGDEVYGSGSSAWAEYAKAKPAKLFRKPAHLSFEQAACMPTSGATARLVLAKGRGEVLVLGAGGGVGAFTVMLAKLRGDRVTAATSPGKIEAVERFGADTVIDYTTTPLAGRYDLIVECGGNRPLGELRKLLKPRGVLAIAGGEDGGRFLGGLERSLQLLAVSPFTKQTLRAPLALTRRADLEALTALTDPPLERSYPLGEAPTAMRRLAEGRVTGKLVLTT
ncbi:NAD(P)-dependent alcohol dehydrogenase [Paractinoplanes atraurantiacus]|uniref:NADPH:quinone reductase n=1 Tax=Paractinoplanes atraurantiacus TaxID=1036182 RepID=A0A285KHP4_9ACTN|nr:NAD(P)-dependent alcohol dehydrogenase [Actinoplanes atraurantiacus]SNY71437.1 NADPH:quinone reductase [Actinoplanes atraurantiacus]